MFAFEWVVARLQCLAFVAAAVSTVFAELIWLNWVFETYCKIKLLRHIDDYHERFKYKLWTQWCVQWARKYVYPISHTAHTLKEIAQIEVKWIKQIITRSNASFKAYRIFAHSIRCAAGSWFCYSNAVSPHCRIASSNHIAGIAETKSSLSYIDATIKKIQRNRGKRRRKFTLFPKKSLIVWWTLFFSFW